jgi:hypothetical protein
MRDLELRNTSRFSWSGDSHWGVNQPTDMGDPAHLVVTLDSSASVQNGETGIRSTGYQLEMFDIDSFQA